MKQFYQRSAFLFFACGFSLTLWASPARTTEFIKVDQFGYFCLSSKVAVIVGGFQWFDYQSVESDRFGR